MTRIRFQSLALMVAVACGAPPEEADVTNVAVAPSTDHTDPRCMLPGSPDTVRSDAAGALLAWTVSDDSVYSSFALPLDGTFFDYRAAVRDDSADVRNPIADGPSPGTDAEAEMWASERLNSELAQRGEAGTVEPIRCLDALLFAYQHARISQLEQPTEFIASVLRKREQDVTQLHILFGAGAEMFPPKSVYGFGEAAALVADGWEYLYVLHNHTIQRNGERLALGTPALSTSDVQLMRALAADLNLQSARVTNGFFTYVVGRESLDRLRSR